MVINNTTIKFWNISWDDIYFSFHTTDTVLRFLDSIEVKVPNNSGETHFTGYSGWGCGSKVYWDFYIDVGLGDDGYSLSVGPEWFYLFVSNQGMVDINYTYVNQGLALAADSCFTTIPNNDYIYPLGYYQALTNSNVYCYLLNHPQYDYVYWGPIVFPGEISQFFWAQTGLFKSMDITVQNTVEPPFERVSESAQGVVSKGYLPMRAVPFDLGRLSRE